MLGRFVTTIIVALIFILKLTHLCNIYKNHNMNRGDLTFNKEYDDDAKNNIQFRISRIYVIFNLYSDGDMMFLYLFLFILFITIIISRNKCPLDDNERVE